MNVLIAGGYDTENLGDYASFLGLQKILKKHFTDIEFSVLTRHPQDGFTREFPVTPIMNLDHSCKAESIGRIFVGFNEGDRDEHLLRIKDAVEACDCIVFGNGRLFVDISLGFMKGPLSYFSILTILAKFSNKPVILSSVTLVHPETDNGKEHLAFILQNASKILVREQSSLEVAKCYVKNSSKIVLLPDIAFALSQADAAPLEIDLKSFDTTFGFNFRGVDFSKTAQNNQLDSTARKITELLSDDERAGAVFISQCTYDADTTITDDRFINRQIYNRLPSEIKDRCTVLNQKLGLAKTLGVYQNIDHLFTSRRHGFILALTQGTPASLICNETNTLVVKETLPFPELYLDSSAPFTRPTVDICKIKTYLENLANKSLHYGDNFDQTIGG